MPVLIMLLYYIHDLSKLKRYHDQTEFVAQQTVNMLQNISQNRSNKRIKKEDLARIHTLAWQTLYPGTLFLKDSVYPAGHSPITSMYYVEGLSDGKASCRWRTWTSVKTSPNDISYARVNSDDTNSPINYRTNADPSTIYPTLNINPGEKKIIVETLIERNGGMPTYKGISDKEAIGLYLANPGGVHTSAGWSHLFRSIVIFTPKEGLFNGTAPE